MGKRYAWIGLITIFFLVASLAVGATVPTISHEFREQEGELEVTTPLANYLFSEDGGTLRSILLTFAPYGSEVTELVAGTITSDIAGVFTRTPSSANAEYPFDLQHADVEFTYTLQEPTYTESGAIVIAFEGEGGGISVLKRFTIEPDALYTIVAEIEINSGAPLVEPLRLALARFTPSAKGRQLTYLYNDERSPTPGPSSLFRGIGLMDDEIVLFLRLDQGTQVTPFDEVALGDTVETTTTRMGVELSTDAGSSTYRFVLYGGRRRFIAMEAASIEALDEPGIFGRLMVYVIRFLNWLYLKTGNFGWAIILFTILMRLLLFPLMRKQYHSMARIQQIQPRLKRVQDKYKDNKEEMQKKILEIYRKEKVNPMSGCFPMAIQLPIIIVIWRALLYASELIHLSPGFLWLPDLSLHDPYFILVVLTTGIMLAQQYFMPTMTTGDAKGPQKYMGYFFPLVMAFFLWRFPAGLWLYYLLTTAAQVGQQAFVNWEMARAGGGQVTIPDDDFIDVDSTTTESSDGDTT